MTLFIGDDSMRNKIAAIAVAIIVAAVIVFVGFMMARDSKAAKFEVTADTLSIQCSFGVDVPLDEIKDLKLTDKLPAIAIKTNGAGIGGMKKGEYQLEDGRQARLYLDIEQPLFITFTQADTVFFLNAETTEDTHKLYDQLQKSRQIT